MNVQRWIARREGSWQELESLLVQSEKRGIKSLNGQQVRRMASLYRSVSGDLARAKSHNLGQELLRDLQQLTSRSYSQVYQGSRRQEWHALVEFYRYGFPEVVRENWAYIAIATLLFAFGGLLGWWFSWQDNSFMEMFLGEGFVEEVRNSQELWTVSIMGQEPIASTGIMVNNMMVSFLVIISGIVHTMPVFPFLAPAGIFSVYILVMNGIMIGSVFTLVAQVNLGYDLAAFVFPHGSLELPAIFIAGGAGLLLARSLLMPAPYRRIDALKVYGLRAVKLVYGLLPMLFIAGIIEGFFSPQTWIPNELKFVVGTAIFVAFVQYCRQKRPVPPVPVEDVRSEPAGGIRGAIAP